MEKAIKIAQINNLISGRNVHFTAINIQIHHPMSKIDEEYRIPVHFSWDPKLGWMGEVSVSWSPPYLEAKDKIVDMDELKDTVGIITGGSCEQT